MIIFNPRAYWASVRDWLRDVRSALESCMDDDFDGWDDDEWAEGLG